MKKKLLVIFVLMGALNIAAQITITQTQMPSLNDTIRFSNSPTGNLTFTTKGANIFWDYTSLGISSQDIYKYQSLVNTPYAQLALSGLPFGSMGYKVADSIGGGGFNFSDIYNFFEKKSSGWLAVGTALTIPLQGTPIKTGGVYSDKDEIYNFPLDYNDFDSTSFKVTTPLGISILNFGSFTQKGTRSTKVEGWGTISTPYAQNISCLKVKSVIREIDSLKLAIPGQQAINVGFPTTRVEYKWLSTTEKIPMLEVSGTEIAGVFTPTTIKYRDNYRVAQPSAFGPNVDFTVNKNMGIVKLDTFEFDNLTSPNIGNTYEWSFIPSTGVRYIKNTNKSSENPVVIFDNVGKYSVKLKGTNLIGFKDTVFNDYINISNNPTSVSNLIKENNVFYPNPANQSINFLNNGFENATYKIIDFTGKIVLEGLINNALNINVSELSAGQYILFIQKENAIYTDILTKN